MPKIGKFDTDYNALVKRVDAHTKYGNVELNDWIFDKLAIQNNDTILDIGCGFGKQSIPLIEKGYSVTAIDASKPAIDSLIAKTQSPKLNAIVSEFDNIDFLPNDYFDKVISSYAFYYSADRENLLSKIEDSMRANASIFICGPSRQNNLEMKGFLNSIGVEFEEGSAPFMDDIAPNLFEKTFGNVEISILENKLEFPSAENVWEYWSSHNMFDKSIEIKFREALSDHFKSNHNFVSTKVIKGIFSKKHLV